MKKTIMIALILINILLISACNMQVTCNKPYIRHEYDCCLDEDENKICDNDENLEQIDSAPNQIKEDGSFYKWLRNVKRDMGATFGLDCPQLPLLWQPAGERVLHQINTSEGLWEDYLICPTNTKYGSSASCAIYHSGHLINSIKKLTNREWNGYSGYLMCRPAQKVGENRQYIYCDLRSYDIYDSFDNAMDSLTGQDKIKAIPYIQKKPKEQGDIIEEEVKVVKSFMNVYTKDGQFVETICGDSPQEILEKEMEEEMREFKDQMRALDNLFTI